MIQRMECEYLRENILRVLIAGQEPKTQNYINAMLHFGVHSDSCFYDLNGNYDGLILPGGGDIDPFFFHQKNTGSRNINRREDYEQFRLLQHFIAHGKPVLGICKGMQIINVYFGGDIIQNLSTSSLHEFNSGDQYHMTYHREGSILDKIYGKAIITNSAHHQGLGRLGAHLSVLAVSKDNVIEAIAHDTLPILGVQWHPERICSDKHNVYVANGCLLLQLFIDMMERNKS